MPETREPDDSPAAEQVFARTEEDVPDDDAMVTSGADGGTDDPRMPDRGSATDTTPNEDHVGRASGPDVSSVEPFGEESGAEARAAAGNTGPV